MHQHIICTPPGLSDQALRDEAMTLLVAGQETSAILLSWAAALLAHHPAVQAAAAAEVAARLPDGRPPAAADVAALPAVTAVVLEALRLYSPAYMVGRCANADVELAGGYRLPKGTTVLVRCALLACGGLLFVGF
jgi:cytochrome P450